MTKQERQILNAKLSGVGERLRERSRERETYRAYYYLRKGLREHAVSGLDGAMAFLGARGLTYRVEEKFGMLEVKIGRFPKLVFHKGQYAGHNVQIRIREKTTDPRQIFLDNIS